MYGFSGAGKTTVVYQYALHEAVETRPSVGFNIEPAEHSGVQFSLHDVCVQLPLRQLQGDYQRGARFVVYVVDSTRADELEAAAADLREVLRHPALTTAPVCVLANKQDLPAAVPPAAVAERLRVHELAQECRVEGCSARTGDGLEACMLWMVDHVKVAAT